MPQVINRQLKKSSPYTAVMTREQFLFYETRTTAKLMDSGLSKEEIVNKIILENLFQYPTEKSVRQMSLACMRRLDALKDDALITAIANEPSDIAKQICLYAMMREYRLVWDFMITVIGEKYRTLDRTFSKSDLSAFFLRLQEQDDWVASWSDNTIVKLKQVMMKMLVETEYLDNIRAERLNPVLISPILENAIRNAGQEIALSAFNCFI